MLNDVGDVLFLTHLAQADDVDWFELPVEQGDRLSVFLSNLPADYDVLLFGPTQAPFRGTPSRSVAPSPDGGLSLLGEDNAVNADIGGDIDTTSPSPDLQLYGVSSRRGTTSERIDTGALPGGTYYLEVTGYNGASSGSPYSLRARTTPTDGGGACAAIPAAGPATLTIPAAVRTVTADTTTIVLTHVGRLQRSYPGSASVAVNAVVDFVNEVNAAPAQFAGTSAAVVTLDDLSAFAAWDQDPCDPDRANDVVSQVGARIDGIRASFPNIQNIVLVGADDQIPFARMKDAVPAHNEEDYSSTFDGSSPLKAALSLGYVLSDNPYASSRPLAVGPRELFVPELGIGRLVESPADIATALGNFTDFHGELDPQTALSTGYDFLTDGADAVADELITPEGRFEATDVDRLNTDDWTRDDLRQSWLGSSAATAADVVSVNAHFDHYRALPADQDSSGVLTDPFGLGDVTGSADGSLAGAIVFSMGCHMGLSVSDISVAGTLHDDWAQVLSAEGAIVAGNTGYGYGDDTVVGATEELMRQFARRLDGSMTVGEAMAFAKQQYTADLLVVSPFDEKVVSQVVFYGLPMYRLADGEPAQPPDNSPTVTDPVTGLQAMPVTVSTPVDVPGGLESQNPSGGNGQFYAVNGEIQATPYQPVQPRTTSDVTQAGQDARGALLMGLTSIDRAMPNPVIMTPTDDVTGANPEARVDGAFFPSALQSIGRRQDVTGIRDQLVVVPGQFRDDSSTTTGGGVQRLFTQTSAVVYYAPDGNTDVVPPVITSTSAAIVGSSAAFTVSATDNAGISRVNVLYSTPPANPSSPRTWSSVDLALAGSVYSGAGLVPSGVTEVDYFVQVVDTGGNVAVGSNKGVNYTDAPLGLAARSDQQAAFDLLAADRHTRSVHRRRTGHGHRSPERRRSGQHPDRRRGADQRHLHHDQRSRPPHGRLHRSGRFVGDGDLLHRHRGHAAHAADGHRPHGDRRSAVGLVHVEPVSRDHRRGRDVGRRQDQVPHRIRAVHDRQRVQRHGARQRAGHLDRRVRGDRRQRTRGRGRIAPGQVRLTASSDHPRDAGGRRHVHDRSGGQRRLQLRRCLRRLRPRCCQWLHGHQGSRSGDRHRNRRDQVVHRHHQGRCRKHDLDHAQLLGGPQLRADVGQHLHHAARRCAEVHVVGLEAARQLRMAERTGWSHRHRVGPTDVHDDRDRLGARVRRDGRHLPDQRDRAHRTLGPVRPRLRLRHEERRQQDRLARHPTMGGGPDHGCARGLHSSAGRPVSGFEQHPEDQRRQGRSQCPLLVEADDDPGHDATGHPAGDDQGHRARQPAPGPMVSRGRSP